MSVYVYECVDNVFYRRAIIDDFKSLIWARRFQTLGDCELYAAASEPLMVLFQKPHIFLMREEDPTSLMLVRQVQLQTDPENGDFLIVKGQAAECIVGYRIVWGQRNLSVDTSGGAARVIINENLTDVSRPAGALPIYELVRQQRGIPCVKLGSVSNTGAAYQAQFDNTNLLDAVFDICVNGGLGLKSHFDGSYIYIDVYAGKDRTINQSVNDRVIFSPDFENIGKTAYMYDNTQLATLAFVMGEGQGTARERTLVEPTITSGLDRREITINASEVSRTTDDGEMPIDEYRRCLAQEGAAQLARRKVKRTFEGEIVTQQLYICGSSYDLGDKVTVQNEYGLTGSAIVQEITEVVDETGRQIYPTLSEWTLEE